MVKKATKVAFFAVCFLRFLDNEAVIDIKIGMVPNGFINVKKEVNTNNAKVYNSATAIYLDVKQK